MPKEFDVTIVETLKMKVTVEADSMEEAEQLVSDGWYRGEYILDAECFEGVEFESAEPVIDLSYREMSDIFHHVNDKHKEPVCGYIVFSQDSFDKPYSEQSRTYVVSSNNKAFISGAGGYSIYGSCLDGTDQCVRLERYMRGENAWKIDRCYMKRDDYERAVSQQVKNKDNREER